MKRIGINILFLIPHEVGGTEFYARSIIAALEKYDTTNEYVVFCNRENANSFSFVSPRWKKVICPVKATNRAKRILFEQFIFPSYIRKERIDVLHSLGYVGPLLCPSSQVLTVHDANWLDVPRDVSMMSRIVQSILMPFCLRTSAVVCTDSKFSRSRIEDHFPWVSKKLVVIPLWVSSKLLTKMKGKNKSVDKKDFILCVSAFYPHKNIPYLLDLFSALQTKNPKYELILVGNNGSDREMIERRLAVMKDVTHRVRVSDEILAHLYLSASAFVFPSTYEGFGYPVYEAASVGVPTIVGRREMYDSNIQQSLRQLTFHLDSDVSLLMNMLNQKKKRQPVLIHTEKDSINKLISIYTSL